MPSGHMQNTDVIENMSTLTNFNMNCTAHMRQKLSEETNNPHITIVSTVINCILVHICAVVGAFGNAIALIILSRNTFKDTSSVILLSMAACDLFYLLNLSVCKLNCIIKRINPMISEVYYPYIVSFVRRPGRLVMFISVTHTVIISLERFISVFFPFQVSQWITRKAIKRALMFVYFAWIVYVTPYAAFNYQIDWTFNVHYNRTMPSFTETKWFIENRHIFDLLSKIIINNITVLFNIIVAINNCAISYRLNTVAKQRISISSTKKSKSPIDMKASRMLLTVCVVSNVCSIPGSAFYVYFYVDPSLAPPNTLYMLLNDLEELMLAVNATANFFVYTVMSAKFYTSVVHLIGCGRLSPPPNQNPSRRIK